MKKIMLFAVAIAALAACSKEAETLVDASHFEKGQKVTLTVKAGEPSTKVSSELNSSTDAIDFKWQANDKIKVTVDGQSDEFTLSSGAGTNSATFTGTMPAGGSTFSVQYPYDNPLIADQEYSSSEALPHDKMLFKADNCQLSKMTFDLKAANSVLRLNLWGAAETQISKIVVTNTEEEYKTYTLTMDPAAYLPTTEDAAKAFFIVIPAGDWNFSAEVFDNAATPASICTLTPSAAQAFAANMVLNMPARKVGKFYPGTELESITIGSTVWAPVNCGYDASHTYGLLYQWGRKYGQAYEDGTLTLTSMTKSDDTEPNKDKFGKYDSSTYNWFSGAVDNTLWSESGKGASDPCPTGWRVPTLDELGSLCYTDWNSSSHSGSTNRGSWDSTLKGWKFGDVFLPAAGYRHFLDGSAYLRGDNGYYWSSSVNGDDAWLLNVYDGNAGMSDFKRALGYSVRCVQE